MTDQLQDLFSFLSLDSRVDLKTIALDYILGLTGSDGGRAMIKASPPVIRLLLQLTSDKQPTAISKDANLVLLNLSSSADIAEVMLDLEVIPKLLVNLVNPEYAHSDAICMTLSNLTQTEKGSELFLTAIMKSEQAQKEEQSATVSSAASAAAISAAAVPSLYQLVDIFDRKDFNKRANFHYLATMFLNITQLSLARQMFLDRKKCILPRLITYTQFYESEIRRGGIVGLLRNLCFDVGQYPNHDCSTLTNQIAQKWVLLIDFTKLLIFINFIFCIQLAYQESHRRTTIFLMVFRLIF